MAIPQPYRRAAVLALRFPVPPGESLVCLRAPCFRFCADGTLRGGDNSIAARRGHAGWRIGTGLYRELECSGPVILRVRRTAQSQALHRGPFALVRTSNGLLIADDAELGVYLPTWEDVAAHAWHEVMLLPAPQPA